MIGNDVYEDRHLPVFITHDAPMQTQSTGYYHCTTVNNHPAPADEWIHPAGMRLYRMNPARNQALHAIHNRNRQGLH